MRRLYLGLSQLCIWIVTVLRLYLLLMLSLMGSGLLFIDLVHLSSIIWLSRVEMRMKSVVWVVIFIGLVLKLFWFSSTSQVNTLEVLLQYRHLDKLILIKLVKLLVYTIYVNRRFLCKHLSVILAFFIRLLSLLLAVVEGTDLRFVTSWSLKFCLKFCYIIIESIFTSQNILLYLSGW